MKLSYWLHWYQKLLVSLVILACLWERNDQTSSKFLKQLEDGKRVSSFKDSIVCVYLKMQYYTFQSTVIIKSLVEVKYHGHIHIYVKSFLFIIIGTTSLCAISILLPVSYNFIIFAVYLKRPKFKILYKQIEGVYMKVIFTFLNTNLSSRVVPANLF